MKATRREFLKGTAWMATAAMASGCMTGGFRICGTGGLMQGYAAPPLKRVRVGLIGLGARGIGAAARLSRIPGVELAAVCDVRKERIEFTQKFLDNQGLCELSEKSVRSGSRPQAVPDFTRGNWRNVAPLGVLDCDMSKLDLPKSDGKADGQMSV